MADSTTVSIEGETFFINGAVTYRGTAIEGRLMNSRMVQATFDDRNPETRGRWDRPGVPGVPGEVWNADRNTEAFVAMLPVYRAHGLLAVTTNFQGGSPEGYSREQPWHNSAFDAYGTLRPADAGRMGRVIDAADGLGMVVILGLFYFGQDERLADEAAVLRACDQTTDWLLERGDRNVLIEIGNEIDLDRHQPGRTLYEHEVLRVERCAELVRRVRERCGGRLLVSTSQCGGKVLAEELADAVDFVLLHGNGVDEPARLGEIIEASRAVPGYRGQPIVVNEDDHYGFDQPENHLAAAVAAGASWGFFDYRRAGEGFAEGYQSVPVDWSIGSERKRGFFNALKRLAEGA